MEEPMATETRAPVVLVLAAGQGTRMRTRLPKALHPLCGRPLALWPVHAALEAGAHRVVVIDGPERPLEGHLPEGVVLAVQEEALGTGHAVQSAAGHIDADRPVIVLAGDVPLITADVVMELAAAHEAAHAAATMLTMILDDPSGYGRVVRDTDGNVLAVVETKTPGDATPQQLAIQEVNTGVLCFEGGQLLEALQGLRADNAQGELYLPDTMAVLRAKGERVAAHVTTDPTVGLGVNDQADLAEVRAIAQARILTRHLAAGVTIIDPTRAVVDVDVTIGAGTVIEPGTQLEGSTAIGAEARIGPQSTLRDTRAGDRARVRYAVCEQADIGEDVSVGPFAYLRPGARLHERSKAGAFVEIKNSEVGPGAKVPHLSYIGDADVGAGANLGASTITANYDGRRKHRTVIGENVKGAVHTSLVAPVVVGDDAILAAGSTITEDVPARALAIARARQHTVEGYADRER
jgi:bifunctional UDP-N-acetylglucosamine pyrophosphorylase/glucosamine-1-phosphate N-acetyltransferase